MTNPSLLGEDVFGGDSPATRRTVSTYTCGHGLLGQQEMATLGNTSVCEVAVGRMSFGGPPIGLLADLPVPPRVLPTGKAGDQHVGVNHRARDDWTSQRKSEEPLDTYIERRLRQATALVLPNRTTAYRASKRALDIVGAFLLVVLAAPLIVALTLLIRFDSPGPAIFRQSRVTRGGRTFTFYKFRTMYVDARERFSELYDYDYSDGDFESSYYKLADDPRNTRVGRWLRRTTLDELPNLFNVLKGDLSLVGPRPELPELVPFYQPENLACLFTKAGLTGLAQVAGRSLLTVRERLVLDTRYVANQTLLLDARILVRTCVVVMTGRGAC
jgi:lipopolysaccharide/colanic/teichoic acid biosynthesis glycosyltransferase